MRFIGPHVSAAGEPAAAVANALAVGATGFALFVKNQRQWVGKPLAEGEVTHFKEALAAAPYAPGQVLPHAGYLINLANPDEEKHAKSLASMLDEVRRCETLGLDRVNVHPGSHLNQISPEAACDRVAESINKVLAETQDVTVVIENTAGQETRSNWDASSRVLKTRRASASAWTRRTPMGPGLTWLPRPACKTSLSAWTRPWVCVTCVVCT